jgi:thiol-disulfide isomerase/thioredoxin
MKKYASLALVVAILLIPAVAMASWWNPFTWFRKAVPATVTVPKPTKDPTNTIPVVTNTQTEILSADSFTAEMSTAISDALKTYGKGRATLQSFTTAITSDTLTVTASLKGQNIIIGNPTVSAQFGVTKSGELELLAPVELNANVLVRNLAKERSEQVTQSILRVLESNRPNKKIVSIALQKDALVLIFTTAPKPVVDSRPKTLAQCLTKNGAKFYGAFWCPHCQATKVMFGTSASQLPYVECSTPDGRGQTDQCTQQGITSYPTWKFKDGTILQGEQTFAALAEKSGCKY